MKTTKHKGTTYQLDESKFKPACIKFDQDMFDDEIYPVLVGLGFEVRNLEANWKYVTNEMSGNDFNFSLTSQYIYEKPRLQCRTAQQFLEASGIFAVAEIVKSFTITAEQAQSIINITCNAWKKQLAEKWSNNIVLGNKIEISEEFYKEMRVACTAPQNELFDKIFGKKDDGSVDLSMLNKSGIDSTTHGMIQVRGGSEHRNKAFFLSGGFNWEIKSDSEGLLCLIPTKKK